jgi:hypothetical protein
MEMTGMEDQRRPRSLVGLVSDLWRDTATLLRDEAELAKTEISQKIGEAGRALAGLAIAGCVLFAGFLLLLAAAVGALAMALPPEHAAWLSPLFVGVVVTVVGVCLLRTERRKLSERDLKPVQSLRSVRKDVEIVKEHIT